jgi:dTDP-4-dehydrorhamnose 3,5-epimerase
MSGANAMQVSSLSLPEVKLITMPRYPDGRGYFTETYSRARFAPHIGDIGFVQDNQSYSAKAFTVRGLHFQAPPHAQAKLVRVLSGAVWDVAVDARKGSPTYGHWAGAHLSADIGEQMFIPEGFLHGFMTLAPDTVITYKVSSYYQPGSEGSVHWASPELAITWPATPLDVTVSEKDAGAVAFERFNSPF